MSFSKPTAPADTCYPRGKLHSHIALDIICSILLTALVVLRYFQQRVVLRPLPASYVVGNVTISLASLMFVGYAGISASLRLEYLDWCLHQDETGAANPDTSVTSMKVCHRNQFSTCCNTDDVLAVLAFGILLLHCSLDGQGFVFEHLFQSHSQELGAQGTICRNCIFRCCVCRMHPHPRVMVSADIKKLYASPHSYLSNEISY